MKTAQDFLKEANDIVERIDTNEAIKKHGSDETIFIDVRDSADIQKTGTIKDLYFFNLEKILVHQIELFFLKWCFNLQ